ncbi:Rgs13 [Acrasis kona]|uniref:Rgs13 n=1 Tax=Acrasis kona TaxID=1008807 RepID=A0AAW2YIB2_9EUKA
MKFKLLDYEVQFDLLLEENEVLADFQKYLELCHVPEAIPFLTDIKQVRGLTSERDIKNTYDSIYHKYFVEGANFELNIDGVLKNAIKAAIEGDDVIKKPLLFFEAYKIVYSDLKEDCLPRYVRSKHFQMYSKKGEALIKKISIHVSQIPNKALLYEPKDFNCETINDRDIVFLLKLAEDSPDWSGGNIDSDPDHFSCYTSRTNYAIGGSTRLKLGKSSGYLSCSAFKAMNITSNFEWTSRSDKTITSWKSVGYKKIDASTPYPIHCSQLVFHFPLATGRVANLLSTVVYDTEKKCYIFLMKTTQKIHTGGYPEQMSDVEPFKSGHGRDDIDTTNFIPISMICGWVFKEISDNKCMFTLVSFYDLKLSFNMMNSEFIFLKFAASRMRITRQLMKDALLLEECKETVFTKATTCMLNDYVKKYLSEEEQPQSSFEPRRFGVGTRKW